MRDWNATVRFTLGTLLLAVASAAPVQADVGDAGNRPLSGRLLITGSGTMTPLVTEIAKRFRQRNPGINVEVLPGGSNRGIADVRQGKADIGMVSRPLVAKERELQSLPIARDGIAVIVHKDNPVRILTDRQITDIYGGKVTNWKQLGGRDAVIMAIKSGAGGTAAELFTQYFGIPYEALKAEHVAQDNATRIKLVVDNPNAIVYISVGEAERNANAGVPIKLLQAGGVAASSKTIRNGNYPISRPLVLVTKGLPSGLTKIFIEFCLSSQITDLVEAYKFVSYLD